jgi:serine/threonine protein kinase
MAAVYVATHRRNENRVALKMLHPELSLNADLRARFLREGYLANKVGHRGAVRVLDDDQAEDGSVFLVMELLEGESLERRWVREKQRLDVEDVLRIADHLLDVLAAAHDKGIVHRDISAPATSSSVEVGPSAEAGAAPPPPIVSAATSAPKQMPRPAVSRQPRPPPKPTVPSGEDIFAPGR